MLKTLLLGLLMLGTPLQSMIDIDGIGINKQALFFGACKQGNIELVEKLINAGVDVNALDSDNKKPALMMGVISGWSVELVKLLINSGANVN
jgi:ankyrin repeat protein